MTIINEDGEVVTLEEAEHIRRTFFRLYPVFKAWHSQTWDDAKAGDIQEVRTALGHRRKFHPSLETWKIVFAALNFPIQSGCAEVLKFVAQDLHKQLPGGAQIVGLLHDEIVLEANEADAQAVMELTLKTMEEVGSVVFSKVHMKAEGSIRDSRLKDRLCNSVVSTGRTSLMIGKENPTRVAECFGMASDASDDLFPSPPLAEPCPPASSSSSGFDRRPVHGRVLLRQEVEIC